MPSIGDPSSWLIQLFIRAGLTPGLSVFLSSVTLFVAVIILSWLSNVIAKAIINNIVTSIVRKTKSTWDDIFLEKKVFTRLSHFAPAMVIWFMAGWALKLYPTWLSFVHKLTYIYMVLAGTIVVTSFIDAWHAIYDTLPIAKHRHIKGYVQLVKIFVYVITGLILFSVIFKKDITSILAGLGAMAAVLILVFKDTLLGLVASIQLSANEMLKIGDWITIPNRDVDGVVTDITLNTVKIQNFDKTIITVPTYSLVNESFQNWKGMESARTRQVKRALYIDVKSIRFLDGEMRQKLASVKQLKDYIELYESREAPLWNGALNGPFFNAAAPTNLGVFRFYAETYLKSHPLVDDSQIVMLRHRVSDTNGIPLQVYLYSKGYQTAAYENLQSEIFEHLFAIMDEFGLKAFQQPSGYDVLTSKN